MASVIFIVSCGHSGSTLLDCVIGSIPGVFSTGELTFLPWQISRRGEDPPAVSLEEARSKGDVCSCLSTFRTCKAWGSVIRRLSEKVGFDVYQNPLRFRTAILGSGAAFGRSRRPWTHFPRYRLPRLTLNVAVQHRALKFLMDVAQAHLREPVENNWLLFDSISEVLGARYVVDSSKDLLRFLMLRSFRPSDIRMIFLIRDVRGMTFSFLRRGSDPIVQARHWVRYNNRIMRVLRENEGIDYQIVLYEQLARDPVSERKRVADFLGLPSPGDRICIDSTQMHLVAGNPLRFQGKITIRHDDAWREELDHDVRRKVEYIARGLDGDLKEMIQELTPEQDATGPNPLRQRQRA